MEYAELFWKSVESDDMNFSSLETLTVDELTMILSHRRDLFKRYWSKSRPCQTSFISGVYRCRKSQLFLERILTVFRKDSAVWVRLLKLSVSLRTMRHEPWWDGRSTGTTLIVDIYRVFSQHPHTSQKKHLLQAIFDQLLQRTTSAISRLSWELMILATRYYGINSLTPTAGAYLRETVWVHRSLESLIGPGELERYLFELYWKGFLDPEQSKTVAVVMDPVFFMGDEDVVSGRALDLIIWIRYMKQGRACKQEDYWRMDRDDGVPEEVKQRMMTHRQAWADTWMDIYDTTGLPGDLIHLVGAYAVSPLWMTAVQ